MGCAGKASWRSPLKVTLRSFADGVIQRIFITLRLFGQNGLPNHAAAGAYGFLLSAAPVLLIVAFFLTRTLQASPEIAADLITGIDIIDGVFDAKELVRSFLSNPRPGITGLISVISILWAARVFAVSLQRGIKVVFPDPDNSRPIRDFAVSFGIEVVVILAVLISVLSSQLALAFYQAFGYIVNFRFFSQFSHMLHALFPLTAMAVITYGAFRLIPHDPPRRKSALIGSLTSIALYALVSVVFNMVINPSRYNFLYGALGSLIILLAKVYFFFNFFFFGVQFCFVIDSFEALAFSHFRQIRSGDRDDHKKKVHFLPVKKLSKLPPLSMRKYIRTFKPGEIIFNRGNTGKEVYYIISGEAEIFLGDGNDASQKIALIREGNFFGEMEYLLPIERSATARAKKDLTVMVLPPRLFEEVLKHDPKTDRLIIESLSKRLKNTNDELLKVSKNTPAL